MSRHQIDTNSGGLICWLIQRKGADMISRTVINVAKRFPKTQAEAVILAAADIKRLGKKIPMNTAQKQYYARQRMGEMAGIDMWYDLFDKISELENRHVTERFPSGTTREIRIHGRVYDGLRYAGVTRIWHLFALERRGNEFFTPSGKRIAELRPDRLVKLHKKALARYLAKTDDPCVQHAYRLSPELQIEMDQISGEHFTRPAVANEIRALLDEFEKCLNGCERELERLRKLVDVIAVY